MPSAIKKTKELRKFLGEGKVEQAIAELIELLEGKDQDMQDQVIILSCQLRHYEKNQDLGIIPPNDTTILARITQATLQIIKIIDRESKIEEQQEQVRAEVKEVENQNDIYYNQSIKDSIQRKKDVSHTKKDFRGLIKNDQESLEEALKKISSEVDENKKIKLQQFIQEKKYDRSRHISVLRQINEIELSNARKQLKRIDFVNRNREKENIKMPVGGTKYWLIDAPAGYGKTELLRELEKEYDDEKYTKAYIQIDHNDKISDVFEKIAKGLKIEISTPVTIAEKDFNKTLPKKLRDERGKDLKEKGLVIFIDFNGKPSGHFRFLQDKVVPALWKTIDPIKNLSQNPDEFKVIYAGRHLSRHANPSIQPMRLSDFDFSAIKTTVENHKDYRYWESRSKKLAAAHILYLTGGHPLCISQALYMDHLQPADFISNINSEKIYNLIKLIAESIEYEFLLAPSWHFSVLKACSVFRKITWSVLEKLKDSLFGLHDVETGEVDDMLRYSHLWKLIPHYDAYDDGIARKVLTISLRHANLKEYKKYCAFAQESCFERINTTKELKPRRWFIEYLFQSLQIHALDVNEAEQRRKVKNEFYSESGDLIRGIKEYKKSFKKSPLSKEVEMLEEEINSDKEFQFTVNYYLRKKDDEYNNDPIEELKRKINEELEKK